MTVYEVAHSRTEYQFRTVTVEVDDTGLGTEEIDDLIADAVNEDNTPFEVRNADESFDATKPDPSDPDDRSEWEPDSAEYGFDPAEITLLAGVDYEAD